MSRLESVLVIDGNGAIVDGCDPTFIPRLPPSVQTKISSEREQIIYWLKRVECSEIEVLETKSTTRCSVLRFIRSFLLRAKSENKGDVNSVSRQFID